MKEAVGGTFLIYVFLVIVAIYIVFLGVAFNYARAFRVKNGVIDIIEQNEGLEAEINGDSLDIYDYDAMTNIENYLKNVHYKVSGLSDSKCEDSNGDDFNYYFDDEYGYCIGVPSNNSGSVYYKVRVFVSLELPFWENFKIVVPVKGETRRFERINS